MPEEISKEEVSTTKDFSAVVDKELEEKKEEKYGFKTHVEVKEYEKKAKIRVTGSAKHENRFSLNTKFIEDNNKIFDVLERLSDHVANLEERVLELEGKKLAEAENETEFAASNK